MNTQKVSRSTAIGASAFIMQKRKEGIYDNAIDSPQHFRYEP